MSAIFTISDFHQVVGVDPETLPTFVVTYGDKSKEVTTKETSVKHQYRDHDTYIVTMVASNPASTQTAVNKVTIMKPGMKTLCSISMQMTRDWFPT